MSRAGIFGSARVAASGITATFQQYTFDFADLTTYTFAAQAIGTASATRRVVVVIRTASTRTVSSVTIGGVSASIDHTVTSASVARLATVSAVVPTGTTADVVVTLDAGAVGLSIGLWTLSAGAPTGQTATDSGASPITMTVTTAVNDVVIGHVATAVASAYAWTGAAERFDDQSTSATTWHAGADTVATGVSTVVEATTAAASSVGSAAAYA
jgi:hypothetical protein